MAELSDSLVKKGDEHTQKFVQDHYPHFFHKNYVLNTPTFYFLIFKAISFFMRGKAVKRMELMRSEYHKDLDKAIGLDRLPKCMGGTNPVPLKEYKNFFDKEFFASLDQGRLGFN